MAEINEGFTFAGKSTMESGYRLVGREAPSPSEKVIVESVPFMHGVYDFSSILGERVFENRNITYQLLLPKRSYPSRKIAEIKIKQWLMTAGIQPLYDTHDIGYYWLGKFTEVTVEDSHTDNALVVSATFDCYPFMVAEQAEGNDIWDTFNFELDVAQTVSYEVNGSKEITLYNVGSRGSVPQITASSAMSLEKNGVIFNVPSGTTKDELFRLEVGENPIKITGAGTIKFEFYKEVMA